MKIPLGLAALCILSGVAHAQEVDVPPSADQTPPFERLVKAVIPVSLGGTASVSTASSIQEAQGPVSKPSVGNDIGALVKAVDFAKVSENPPAAIEGTVPSTSTKDEVRQPELGVIPSEVEELKLKEKIELAKLELARNKQRQSEIVNHEIEKSLSMNGQDLTTVRSILKDRVITYSVRVYALTDDPLPPVAMGIETDPRIVSEGTVITTLETPGRFFQSDNLKARSVTGSSNKDVHQKINSHISIDAVPAMVESGKIASRLRITTQIVDDLTASRSKGADVAEPPTSLIESETSFISKVIDLMSDKGAVHVISSDKYKIVISASLD